MQSIFLSSRELSSILAGRHLRKLFSGMRTGTPLSLDGSRLMLLIMIMRISSIPYIKTFLTRWSGTRIHMSGLPGI
jgi:hypothetical protein